MFVGMAVRQLGRRPLRSALTGVAIALGVANVFGVLITNEATDRRLKGQLSPYVGRADVSVHSASRATAAPDEPPTIPPQIAEALGSLPHVEAVAREALSTGRAVSSPLELEADPPGNSLTVIAVDSEAHRRGTELEAGRLYRPHQPEAVLTRPAADRVNVQLGDSLLFGDEPLEIVGILSGPDDNAFVPFDRMVTATDNESPGALHVYLDPTISPDIWIATHKGNFPEVSFSSFGVSQEFETFMGVVQSSLLGAAAIAILIAVFLIHLTFTLAIAERTRAYGILHATGATGGQVARSVFTEACILAAPACIFGLGLGFALATGLVRLLERSLQLGALRLVVTPSAAAIAVTVGVLASLVGAWIPARRAGRIAPVEAIRGTIARRQRTSPTWVVGVGLVTASIVFHWAGRPLRGATDVDVFLLAPPLLTVIGAVLILPLLVRPLSAMLQHAVRRLAPGLGHVALGHITREQNRSAYTLGLVMVVLAMIFTLGVTRSSIGAVLDRWATTRFGADLLVYGQLPEETRRQVLAFEGIDRVTTLGIDRVLVNHPEGTGALNLIVIDPDTFFEVAGFPWASGSEAQARAALHRGGSVLLPGPTAARLGLEPGAQLEIQTKNGPRSFVLAATYASIAAGPEIGVVVSQRDGERHFSVGTDGALFMDGPTAAALAEALGTSRDRTSIPTEEPAGQLLEALGPDLSIVPGSDVRTTVRRELDTYMGLFLVVLLVAAFVGVVGLATTTATRVVQRYRQIGILQAVGAEARSVKQMIVAETCALVAIALALALPLGLAVSYLVVGDATARLGFGIRIVIPWPAVLVIVALACLVAIGASVLPARRAARLTPVEALRWE